MTGKTAAPPQSRVLCCRLCLTSQGTKKKTGMQRSGPTPSAFRRACRPGGSGTGEAPTAAADRHRCWTNAGTYVRVYVCLCICGLRMCADSTTPSYLAVFGWLAGRMRGRRTRGGGSAGRTTAVAGPADYLKNALLRVYEAVDCRCCPGRS